MAMLAERKHTSSNHPAAPVWNIERMFPYALATTVLACYWTSLGCGIVYDDIAAVQNNPDLRPHRSLWRLFQNDFWGTPMYKEQSHKSYRPLCVLTYRLNFALHGSTPLGYHIINVICHYFVCLIYYKTCLIFVPHLAAFVAAMLFSVHPIHTEAVTTITGRAELLSALFFLLSLYLYIHERMHKASWRKIGACLCLASAGFLCKEQCITVVGVWIVYDVFIHSAKSTKKYIVESDVLKRLVVFAIFGFSIFLFRFHLMGKHWPSFSRFDNPASYASTPSRQLTYNYLIALNSWLLLFPSYLCCDWTMGTVPLLTSFFELRNLVTISSYTAFAILVWFVKNNTRHRPVIIMSLALIILPFVPATNLFFPVGFVVAERLLYLPSMGFCLLVAFGWHLLFTKLKWKKIFIWSILILLGFHSLKTFQRNKDWQTEFSIYSSALKINKNNAKLFSNMGKTLEKMGHFEEALSHYYEAIRLQHDDIRGYLNSGRLLTSTRKFKEAEDVYLKARSLLPRPLAQNQQVQMTPSHLQVFVGLASLLSHNESRLEEADSLLKEAIKMRSDFTDAYVQRGDILLRLNRSKEAEAVYQRALQFDDSNADLYHNLGVIMMDQGRSKEALALFNTALKIDPDHQQALMSSAILIQEAKISNHAHLASERLQRIIYQGKEDEHVYFNLGKLSLENKDYASGEKWFKKAVNVNPSSQAALFNLALLLSQMKRPLESLAILRRLEKINPQHVKGLALLGDIYYNELKDGVAAEECFKRILNVDPSNVQAAHNLCVLALDNGFLHQAEDCFLKVSEMDPSAQYVRHHLDVTRSLLLKFASTS